MPRDPGGWALPPYALPPSVSIGRGMGQGVGVPGCQVLVRDARLLRALGAPEPAGAAGWLVVRHWHRH